MDEKSLKDLRITRGLFQREVAEKVGVSIPFYSMVESGIRLPSLKCSKDMAYMLGISLDDFYKLVENNINKI